MNTTSDILLAIDQLSDGHILKNSPIEYRTKFAEAALLVYSDRERAEILKRRFFVPESQSFDLNKYFEAASELSVQNHFALNQRLKNFGINIKVNPPKDVDIYYEIDSLKVALEVKCPQEQANDPDKITVKYSGRDESLEKRNERVKKMRDELAPAFVDKEIVVGKNRDNTLKDFLVGSHNKYFPQPTEENINILLIACGYAHSLGDYWRFLYADYGIFTGATWLDPQEFSLVDVVLLTNIKYLHRDCREYHDWTLKRAFIVPFINPHKLESKQYEQVSRAFLPFNHKREEFRNYNPYMANPDMPFTMALSMKMQDFIQYGLSESERNHYFPVHLKTDS